MTANRGDPLLILHRRRDRAHLAAHPAVGRGTALLAA